MTSTLSLDFATHFSGVDDPRIDRSKVYPLLDILFVSVAGTLAGCDGSTDIADFARTQLAWCRKFVPLKNGAPAHDTIGRAVDKQKSKQQPALVQLRQSQQSPVPHGSAMAKLLPIASRYVCRWLF